MNVTTSTLCLLIGANLIFFMQAGFAMMETGYTRAKNASNIILKNLVNISVAIFVFWFLGFGLMFSGTGPVVGGLDLFASSDYSMNGSFSSAAFVLFQTLLCAVTAVIVVGAMAERTRFPAFMIYCAVISLIIYPVSGHWVWGGGWLSRLGFHDYAGSAVVHLVGGVAAFFGAKMIGPRIGKYTKEGHPRAIPGHNLTMGALGVFILWFCWFGLTMAASVATGGIASEDMLGSLPSALVNTNLSAAAATLTAIVITWVRYKKPDISIIMNGTLAGLVAISSGADVVQPLGAVCIGILAAVVAVLGIEIVEQKLQIDDPVGASSVHGFCGGLGAILTGLFSTNGGLFYGGGLKLLGVQLLGVAFIALWVTVISYIALQAINNTVGLRISEKDEIQGLITEEHGTVKSYEEFMPTTGTLDTPANPIPGADDQFLTFTKPIPVEEAVPVTNIPRTKPVRQSDGIKMTQITIITKESKFEALKDAMDKIGITGMTVTQVMGCGFQRGNPDETYRGVPLDMALLPKVKIDIVVCKVPPETVINTAKRILYTGHIGDGKIFVSDIENVIKVRTGEEGYDALQDEVGEVF